MSITDKILKFACRCLGLIFVVVAAFAFVGCIFGLILMRHLDNPAEIFEQVKSLGFVALICIFVSFTFHTTAELIN